MSNTMIAPSHAGTALADIRHQRLRTCAELQCHTNRTLVFARSEALELLAIEKPNEPASERRRNGICDVIVATKAEKTHLAGVRFLTWSGPIASVTINRSIECTTPVCTWAHYASILPLGELIVLGDSMMRRNRHLTRATLDDFRTYLASAPQFAGIRRCRQAFTLMREGTDSSMETRTRLLPMQFGLPELQVNHPVRLGNGRTVLLDMAYPELRIAVEYDGAYHRFSGEQVLRDDKRREALEDLGWIYIKVTFQDLIDAEAQERFVQRLATRCEDVVGVPVPLVPQLTLEQVCDGRRLRKRPFWERIPRERWTARWARGRSVR